MTVSTVVRVLELVAQWASLEVLFGVFLVLLLCSIPTLLGGWWLVKRLRTLEALVNQATGQSHEPLAASGEIGARLTRLEKQQETWLGDQRAQHDEDVVALLGSLLTVAESVRRPSERVVHPVHSREHDA